MGYIACNFITAFAKYDWQVYVGFLPGITSGCITTLARSIMTKLVGSYEVGKILAFNGCIQVRVS